MRVVSIPEGGMRMYEQTMTRIKDTVQGTMQSVSSTPTLGTSGPEMKTRKYKIEDPKVISDISKVVSPSEAGISAKEADYPPEMQNFVKATNRGLTLDGQPFFITGFNNYYLVTRAAWLGEGRNMTDEVFESARNLGSNTLRIWGFVDGDNWNALQPEAGVIDEKMFSNGLDYVVANAQKYGIRLIVSFTNYWDAYGGMLQYVKWANKTSIADFYTDPQIKSMFKDYIYYVINRKNTVDGVLYKNNPAILGWEIANEPRDPGVPGSPALQAWIEEIAGYVKKLDSNHLVMVGSEGFFGPSTASKSRLSANPYTQVFAPISKRPYHYDAVCEGADFEANNKPNSIDIAVIHAYPDHWAACDDDCKTNFAKRWIRHHLEAAAELGRPLLIGEFNALKPVARRNSFIQLVHTELVSAAKKGYPVAGSLAWMLTGSSYPDYDGFSIYHNNETAAHLPRPPWNMPDTEREVERASHYKLKEMLECMAKRAEEYVSDEGLHLNDGWEDTSKIISDHVQELNKVTEVA
ncbi:hypothetical protein BSKO_04806 [Bryopsis sp. KO-2023]|nr:hypothetical protein BSKO_04806 [Bryopsis sp. KO-2023]